MFIVSGFITFVAKSYYIYSQYNIYGQLFFTFMVGITFMVFITFLGQFKQFITVLEKLYAWVARFLSLTLEYH